MQGPQLVYERELLVKLVWRCPFRGFIKNPQHCCQTEIFAKMWSAVSLKFPATSLTFRKKHYPPGIAGRAMTWQSQIPILKHGSLSKLLPFRIGNLDTGAAKKRRRMAPGSLVFYRRFLGRFYITPIIYLLEANPRTRQNRQTVK